MPKRRNVRRKIIARRKKAATETSRAKALSSWNSDSARCYRGLVSGDRPVEHMHSHARRMQALKEALASG